MNENTFCQRHAGPIATVIAVSVIIGVVALSGWIASTMTNNHRTAVANRESYLGKEAAVINSNLIVKTLYWVDNTSTIVCRVDNGEKAMPRFTEVKFRADELFYNFQEASRGEPRAGTTPRPIE